MLKFGLVRDESGNYEIEFIKSLSSFLCYVLALLTGRKKMLNLQSLEAIIQKDTAMKDYSANNPIQKSVFDIKYSLLNKKNWYDDSVQKSKDTLKNEGSSESEFIGNLMREIIEIFHFLTDLRQSYLISTSVEMLKETLGPNINEEIMSKTEEKSKNDSDKLLSKVLDSLSKENSFNKNDPKYFSSLEELYEETKYSKEELQAKGKSLDLNDKFSILLINLFNISRRDDLKQMILTLICR
jgi:hypothetical protein